MDCRQAVQWQFAITGTSPLASNEISPQRHFPVSLGISSLCILVFLKFNGTQWQGILSTLKNYRVREPGAGAFCKVTRAQTAPTLLRNALAPALILIAMSFLTSAISAAFGLGGGVAMLITLLSLTPPIIALPVHAIIQIGSNAGRAAMLRSHVMPRIVTWFIPGTLLGVFIGSQIFVNLPKDWLQVILALFILWTVWAPKIRAKKITEQTYFGVGAVVSFGGMFLGATGPLLGAFLSPDRYGRDATVSTHAACMAFQHAVRIIAFGLLGFVIVEWLPLVIAMIVSGLAGTWAGGSLLKRIPEQAFKFLFRSVLSLLALRLFYKAIFG